MNRSDYGRRALIFAGLCIWLVSAFFSDGYFQADEHFQIIEFAHYKLGNISSELLPWEYAARMRPGFQPLLAFVIIKSCVSAGVSSPFIQAMLLRLITLMLAFSGALFFFRRLKQEYHTDLRRALLWALLFFLWFMPLLGVRFSSENLSGICMIFLLGILLPSVEKISPKNFLLAGVVGGFAFLFRYQSTLMIGGLFFWMILIQKPGWKKTWMFLTGLAFISACGFLADRWLYGEWVCAPWNYFNSNLLQDKLSTFGVKPWHHYFSSGTEQMFLPVGVLIWISAVVFWITKHRSPLTWISLPFVLFHVLLAHKEVRFLFPLFYLIPVFVVQTAVVISRFRFFQRKKVQIILIALFFLLNLPILMINLVRPMDPYVGVLHQVHTSEAGPKLIYYTDNDPLNPFGVPLSFYHTKGIQTIKTERAVPLSELSLPSDTSIFLLEELKGLNYRKDAEIELIQGKYPVFLRSFNPGNWQARTSNWALYRIR